MKYRVLQVRNKDSEDKFYPQRKFLGIWWTLTGVGGYYKIRNSLKEALEEIEKHKELRNKPKYIIHEVK